MNLAPLPIQKFFSNIGLPLVGGKLFTYAAGTNTKIATYTDSTGGSLNTNPIILNFRGECSLWIDPQLAYKFVLSGPFDSDPPTNPIWSVDNVTLFPANGLDNTAVATGTANAIALAIPKISAPIAFTRIIFKAANTNTGPTTISINGGTAKNVTWQNIGAFSGGEIQASGIYEAVYDGAQWQLQGPTLQPPQMRTAQEIAVSVTPSNYSQPIGRFERYGAKGDGTTDDTTAIQNAFKVGGYISGIPGKTYKMTDAAGLVVSGTVVDLSGCTLNQTTAATPAFYIGRTAASSTFVKTDRVRVIGGVLQGAVAGAGSPAYGITIVQPTDSPYVNGNGCNDIEITDVKGSGFTGGIVATAASNVVVRNCRFGGMIYHIALGAGGYGAVLQTCFDCVIDANYFKATSTDRHAIYISGDPSRANAITNVCNGVVIIGNRIDWSAIGNVTGFEACMAIRAPQRLVVNGNTLEGGRGGIDSTSENANFYNPVISNNTIRNLTSRQAIIISKGASANVTFDAVIEGNSIFIDNAASSFFVFENVEGFALNGNSAGAANLSAAASLTDCSHGTIGGNTFRSTTGGPNGVLFSGTCDNILINRNGFTANFAGVEYRFFGTMTNLKYGYVRRAAVSWSGGTATITDPDNMITSAASNANGFDVTFDGWVASIALENVQLLSGSSTIGEAYHRGVAGQVLTVGVDDFAGAPLPAASNDYKVQVSLLS